MKNSYRDDSFNARMQNAAKAKKAAQDRIKARELRHAERKAAREVEIAQIEAEKIARELAEQEEALREADAAVALQAELKAARDARYAARKARRR